MRVRRGGGKEFSFRRVISSRAASDDQANLPPPSEAVLRSSPRDCPNTFHHLLREASPPDSDGLFKWWLMKGARERGYNICPAMKRGEGERNQGRGRRWGRRGTTVRAAGEREKLLHRNGEDEGNGSSVCPVSQAVGRSEIVLLPPSLQSIGKGGMAS